MFQHCLVLETITNRHCTYSAGRDSERRTKYTRYPGVLLFYVPNPGMVRMPRCSTQQLRQAVRLVVYLIQRNLLVGCRSVLSAVLLFVVLMYSSTPKQQELYPEWPVSRGCCLLYSLFLFKFHFFCCFFYFAGVYLELKVQYSTRSVFVGTSLSVKSVSYTHLTLPTKA